MADKIMLRDYLFLSKDHWEDRWTYGDWRQFVARRPDGALQPSKHSGAGILFSLIGFAFLALTVGITVTAFWIGEADQVRWPGVVIFFFVGLLPFIPQMLGYSLMTAVASRSYDGLRHF